MRRLFLAVPLLCLVVSGCAGAHSARPRTDAALPSGAQAWSLFGEPLYPPTFPPEIQREREIIHSQAEIAWQVRPASTDTRLSLIRRLMDLGRYREALPLLDEGEESFPTSPHFPRLRAEVELALRRFDGVPPAVDKALQLFGNAPNTVERETTLNPRGQPVIMVRANLYAYLGLARYAQGDFAGAAAAFRDQLSIARDADADATARLWLHLALLAGGQNGEAAELLEPVNAAAKLLGDPTAHRVLLYLRDGGDEAALLADGEAGTLDLDLVEASLGLRHLARGERGPGVRLLQQVVSRGNWPSPAALLAEVQLVRLGEKAPRPKG